MGIRKTLLSLLLTSAMVIGCATSAAPAKAATTIPTITAPVMDVFAVDAPAVKATMTLGTDSAESTDTAKREETAAVLPIVVTEPGCLVMQVTPVRITESFEIRLYTDADCKSEVVGADYAYMSKYTTDTKKMDFKLKQAGTYYLKAKFNYTVAKEANSCDISTYAYRGTATDINSEAQLWKNPDSSFANYHRMVVGQGGLVTLTGFSMSDDRTTNNGLSVSICDANKAELTSDWLKYGEYAHITLKAGTYYVATKEDDMYSISFGVTPFKNQGATKKSKAKLIKPGKTVQGYMHYEAPANTKRWFKVKLTKKKKLKLVISNYSDHGWLRVQVTSNNKRFITKSSMVDAGKKLILSSSGKLSKGTYYVCAEKAYDYDSAYKIKYCK